MRFRSTGLGKTELIGEIADLTRHEDYLILHIHTTEPVRWHIRAGLTYKDMVKVIMKAFKLSVISFVLFGFNRFKNPRPPGEF